MDPPTVAAVFEELERFRVRPTPFCAYTAQDLWADPYISERMLGWHLDPDVSRASRTSEFIGRSLRWLRETIGVQPGSRVLDLGCGPGLYSNPLAADEAHVTGVDMSERSLAHARSQAPADASVDYITGNYLEVDIPGTFDLAIMVMCDYSALSPDQRHTLLDRLTSLLIPGGRFVFDVHALGSLHSHHERVVYAPDLMRGFWAPPPYHGFLHTFVYEDERVTLDKYEIIEPHRRRTIFNWLQHFDADSIKHELEGAGFNLDQLTGDLAGADFYPDADELGVVATRPLR